MTGKQKLAGYCKNAGIGDPRYVPMNVKNGFIVRCYITGRLGYGYGKSTESMEAAEEIAASNLCRELGL